jgi:predicted MPP superfamily phosphohydrolase
MDRFAPSLDHRISAFLQKQIQLARSEISRRNGGDRFDRAQFEVKSIPIPIQGLDPAFDGYRLVHISDIHLGQWMSRERLEGVVEMINEQRPDMVAITGDLVSYVLDQVEDDLKDCLSELRAADASVMVLGNHDHWTDAERIREIVKSSNVLDISNDVLPLRRSGATLNIAGIDDVMTSQDRLDLVVKKLQPSSPAILLVHEPDFADVSAKTGCFDLQLSGHSHGGQFVLPFIGTPIRGYMFRRYPLGLYRVREMIQYTNRGLGTNLFWSRINCPPEITVFDLLCSER